MGICPDWYELIQAAKYLGVAPWDLLKQSEFWKQKALTGLTAENNARKILEGGF